MSKVIFGIPGEENLAIMDALLDSPIRFVTTRHEQGAAFMADVYGRLTGKAGVCLSTLGPGATNLVTGVADANMDHAPVVAISGQAATTRLHKESHQVLDLVKIFEPITKYATQILEPEVVPEITRKAFKLAQLEKPGACFISFPENIAAMETAAAPLAVQSVAIPSPAPARVKSVAATIAGARFPVIMAGNGVVRTRSAGALVRFAEALNIPVATTFMAKGVMPASHPLGLGTVGLAGARLRAVRLRPRRRDHLRRLRHGRVPSADLARHARPQDRAHRHPPGGGGRALRAGRRRRRRHRRDAG